MLRPVVSREVGSVRDVQAVARDQLPSPHQRKRGRTRTVPPGPPHQHAEVRSGHEVLFGVLFGITGSYLGAKTEGALAPLVGALIGTVLGAVAGRRGRDTGTLERR
jgi:hypothetical protein